MGLAMIAVGFLTILQSLRLSGVGSGYLCPPVVSAIYLPSSIAAAAAFGFPVVCGMVMFAGGCEVLVARLVNRLRKLFPAGRFRRYCSGDATTGADDTVVRASALAGAKPPRAFQRLTGTAAKPLSIARRIRPKTSRHPCRTSGQNASPRCTVSAWRSASSAKSKCSDRTP